MMRRWQVGECFTDVLCMFKLNIGKQVVSIKVHAIGENFSLSYLCVLAPITLKSSQIESSL